MAKLDRLGWAAGATFQSFGVRFGVRTNDPRALAGLAEHLPPGTTQTRPGVVDLLYSIRLGGAGRGGLRPFNLLYAESVRLARTMDAGDLFELFEADLRLSVAAASPRRVFVHAGVVGWRGRAVLIPGASLSGKTSLVAELVKAGARYYSDEYAVLDARGRVHPYTQPLQLREAPGARQSKVPVEALGGRAGRRPLRAGLVVVASYRQGAAWRARRLSAGRGLLELLSHTVSARRAPRASLEALRRVVAAAPVIKAVRGEAREAARRILDLL